MTNRSHDHARFNPRHADSPTAQSVSEDFSDGALRDPLKEMMQWWKEVQVKSTRFTYFYCTQVNFMVYTFYLIIF